MNLKTLIPVAGAALALCFSACSDDKTSEGPTGVTDNGAPALLSLTINEPATRESDDNALEAESRFVTADIFIYSGNSLAKHVRLKRSDFTNVGAATDNRYITAEPILTTEGAKVIYAGLNLPEALGKEIAATGSVAGLELIGNTDKYTLDSDKATDGFVMFSVKPEPKTLLPITDDPDGTLNKATIVVGRLVAKITVEEGEFLEKDVIGGSVKDLKFAMRNVNKLFYPYQKNEGGIIVDPNHWDGSYRLADFNQASLTAVPDEYLSVDPFETPVLDRNVKYAPENTTEMKYQYETTYASVQAVFIPEYLSDVNGQLTANSAEVGDFWTVTLNKDGSVYYFTDEADATTFATNKGVVSDKYKGGKCYYNLFLNQSGKFQTYRNTFYQLRITSILGLGNPNPEDGGDGKIPVTEQALMLVDIDIQPWKVVLDNYDLY